MSRPAAIELRGVSFGFNARPVLEGIELTVPQGEFLGLVGPNGSGKTTLLKLVLGLWQPTSGRVRVLGGAPEAVRQRVGYVPQFAEFERGFPISVETTVLMGRLGRTRMLGGYRRVDREAARAAMAQTQVEDLAARPLDALSGGELQRVLIARALACEPELLLLDEPTASVDFAGERDIFEWLRELNRRMTIVTVSHDVGFISRYVDRVACVNRTLVCHEPKTLTGQRIEELYERPVRMIHHAADHPERSGPAGDS